MSASGVREMLSSEAGVIRAARVYFGIALTAETARRCVLGFGSYGPEKLDQYTGVGWQAHSAAVSAGPLVWLKMRIAESSEDVFSGQAVDDDHLPLVFTSYRKRRVLGICAVARSKMFRTEKVVFPIDLTSLRVAGWPPDA